MNAAAEARDLIAEIAGPLQIGSKVKTAIGIVARRTGLTERRVRGLWNRERAVRADELEALRRAARAKQKAEFDVEMDELRQRLAMLEARLAVVDAAFHGPTREALRGQMGVHRRMADGE